MGTPLYSTDIIPLTSRPTLTVMDDGDYFVILDTSTGKISKILKTNIMTALKITYDNTTSELTAETVQAALDELVVNLGSSDSAILALAGRLDTLEGTGAGSVAKAIDDAVSPLAEVVDTNRLYSDSQYLELKAKADALQVKCNTLQAEVYTDDPILQYGAVEIIGDGYEADATPIDVSANVVDGKLSMEQKGLTITNLITNGNFLDISGGLPVGWNIYIAGVLSLLENVLSNTVTINGTFAGFQLQTGKSVNAGDKIFIRLKIKIDDVTNVNDVQILTRDGVGGVVLSTSAINVASLVSGEYHYENIIHTVSASTNNLTLIVRIKTSVEDTIVISIDGNYGVSAYNLTALGLDHITDTDILAKLLPYVDGTKAVGKMGIQILDADDAVTQTIFLPAIGNSLPNGVADSIKTVADGWEHTKMVGVGALSAEKMVNGGFSSWSGGYPTSWSRVIGAGTTITEESGACRFVSDNTTYAELLQDILTVGKLYKIEFDITVTSGSIFVYFGGRQIMNVTASGHYTRYYTALSTGISARMSFFKSIGTGGFDVLIDNVSVKEIATTAGTPLAISAQTQVYYDGTNGYYQLATPITTHYDLPLPTSGKTIHRFAGEEKIALYGTGLTFSENVLSVIKAIKFVAGVMTDITDLATITGDTVTFSGVDATDVVYVKVEHSVNRQLGILEHTPAVSNTASRLKAIEDWIALQS